MNFKDEWILQSLDSCSWVTDTARVLLQYELQAKRYEDSCVRVVDLSEFIFPEPVTSHLRLKARPIGV